MRIINSTMEICLTREDVELAIERLIDQRFRRQKNEFTGAGGTDYCFVKSITVHPEAKYLIRAQVSHDKKKAAE